MRICLGDSRANGFAKWSITHRPGCNNDDDQPGGAAPITLADPHLDDSVMALSEQPHRPSLVRGVSGL
jgi:hypothetical protein